jgi:hypothetical protein
LSIVPYWLFESRRGMNANLRRIAPRKRFLALEILSKG